ncbi:hypothetical protein PAXRUDRAFT_725124 [Paxillus rubicundulus Ve08.2h10]|uniref:Uncharacterized protein n=1 Tax=Paxillus rubicundulus Ve08.2h10 TaxID=930991 RepID=A0A0D0E7Z1_9AGAM|nr:hypothetical protein PAXRUDRAFT_725124 [Paxillus rubicundulus Ve08.2h10]
MTEYLEEYCTYLVGIAFEPMVHIGLLVFRCRRHSINDIGPVSSGLVLSFTTRLFTCCLYSHPQGQTSSNSTCNEASLFLSLRRRRQRSQGTTSACRRRPCRRCHCKPCRHRP